MQPNATYSSLKQVILNMSVGEVISLPIGKTVNVRACASQVGLANCRKYRTFTRPDERVIKVVRVQ